jgi:DDE family transposase
MNHETRRPSTWKVRRDIAGGKRGSGNSRHRRVRRPDPRTWHAGAADANLTGVAGLVPFGGYLRKLGVDRELARQFGRLKADPRVVYPMGAQMRLLIDAFAVGEGRVFGLEALAADPLFVDLAGGAVPSLDTVYADLERFADADIALLEAMVAEHGLVDVAKLRGPYVHLDVDTSVVPLFGAHEGGVPGPNPRYHGRPSYHPMLARIAETDTIVGAQLRPGDTGLGVNDVPTIRAWAARAKRALQPKAALCVRIDAGGDCAELLEALHDEQVFFLVKGRMTADMNGAIVAHKGWRTVDEDADGKPNRQIAEIDFTRESWSKQGMVVRVIAVRSRERHGRQLPFPGTLDVDWTVQVFLTNRADDADDIAWDYDRRAGIEPLIAELKGAWSIGQPSSYAFRANHVVLLLKMLSHNLLDRYARDAFTHICEWRTPWRRRVLLRVPGRLSRSGRRRRLHVHPASPLQAVLRE